MSPSSVSRDPFPYVYQQQLLEESLCKRIAERVPPPSAYTKKTDFQDDQKFYRPGRRLLTDPEVSEDLKQLVRDNVSPEAFYDFYRLFGPDIEREFPELEGRLRDIDPKRIGLRGTGNHDVLMEAGIVYFMPIHGPVAAERGAHVKTSEKIYGSFFCLRTDEDLSTGGDIELHKVAKDVSINFRNQIGSGESLPVRKFPRTRNSYIGFLNTRRSVNAMTPRSKSALPSVYLIILVELSPRMWNPSLFSRLIGWRRW